MYGCRFGFSTCMPVTWIVHSTVISRIFRYAFYYMLGIWIYKRVINRQSSKPKLITVISVWVAFASFETIGIIYSEEVELLSAFGLIVALSGVTAIIFVSSYCRIIWLEFIGRYTLPIYLVHVFLIVGLRIPLSMIENQGILISPSFDFPS